MMGGYWEKELRIVLDEDVVEQREVPSELLRRYIGGAGFAAKLLADEVPADCDPLDRGNLLIFSTGPFQASRLSGSAKFSIVTRSPLTGIFADSAAGADWGIKFKRTGFDFLTLQGTSITPVYILVTDNRAEILPADDLWGMGALEVTEMLRERHPGAAITAIGPAGERQVALAGMLVDGFSAAGRGGTGAVCGSKRVKAVVVNGTLQPPVADADRLRELEKRYRKSIFQAAEGLRAGGTIGGLAPGEAAGNLPVRNWSQASWPEGAQKIGYPGYETLNPRPHACMYCSIACHRSVDVTFPDGFAYTGSGPEYESLALLGASCMIDDLETLVKANLLCNEMGLDTMSAGSCAAFAMEAMERGDTLTVVPGYPFGWGIGSGLLSFIEELGSRSGFGGLFSGGIRQALSAFKPAAAAYAQHVKGMDIPAHDPRVYYNLALSYATGNRGACHMRAYSQISTMGALLPEAGIDTAPEPDSLDGAAEVVKTYQDFTAFYNACVMCQFMIWGGYGLGDMVESLNTITGWNMSVSEVMEVGDRIFTLQRKLNTDWGVRAADDTLPKRFFEPSTDGGRRGKYPADFSRELARLYVLRGWDEDGIPTAAKLQALGIPS